MLGRKNGGKILLTFWNLDGKPRTQNFALNYLQFKLINLGGQICGKAECNAGKQMCAPHCVEIGNPWWQCLEATLGAKLFSGRGTLAAKLATEFVAVLKSKNKGTRFGRLEIGRRCGKRTWGENCCEIATAG